VSSLPHNMRACPGPLSLWSRRPIVACSRRQTPWGWCSLKTRSTIHLRYTHPTGVQKGARPGTAAAALISAISALGHCAAPGAAKQLVPSQHSLLAKWARTIPGRTPPGREAAVVKLMVAVQHTHAQVRRAAAIAASRIFRCAVGWRGERLEAYRAARLGLSAHLDKELVQP